MFYFVQDAGSAGTFKGFSGFSGFSKTTDAATAFGNLGSKPLTITNGPATVTGTSKTTLFTASKTNDTAAEKELTDSKESKDLLKTPPLTNGKGETKSSSSAKSKYLNELKTLNEGVTKWIKEHVDKNPYCILSPIFKDYEKYLLDLEKKYPHHSREKDVVSEETDKDTSADDTKDSITPPKSTSKFSFGTSGRQSDIVKRTVLDKSCNLGNRFLNIFMFVYDGSKRET
jgi:nuclear pore complex protein Nup50